MNKVFLMFFQVFNMHSTNILSSSAVESLMLNFDQEERIGCHFQSAFLVDQEAFQVQMGSQDISSN